MMKRIFLGLTALAVTLGSAEQAGAGLLVDLEDPPGETDIPFALPFIAGSDATTITFAGYQLSSSLEATNIDLFLTGGGPNLLGGTWDFTPPPVGSFASTFDDGTGIPALQFEGFIEDSFDTFSQTIATVSGQSYTLSFLFSNGTDSSAPSGFVVSTVDTADAGSAVPEPSSLVMTSIVSGIFGVAWARKRLKRTRPA
jgi:hypothetical protein